jgi:hypothetical protein
LLDCAFVGKKKKILPYYKVQNKAGNSTRCASSTALVLRTVDRNQNLNEGGPRSTRDQVLSLPWFLALPSG